MARKTRRQKQRAVARQSVPTRPGTARPAPADAATAPVADEPADLDLVEPAVDDDEGSAEPVRSPVPAAPAPSTPTPVAAAPAVSSAPASAGAGAPQRRRIERLSQTTAAPSRAGRPGRGPSNAAALFQPLETEDAAIPFDRVPYVPADLRRVLVMAACMVVLIIIAAVVVTHVVH